ncbi:MAG TPA: PqqD family protein, partial [Flavisolibacter sp.]|nr:PqqD family protein [Flavisolibacter sp.]
MNTVKYKRNETLLTNEVGEEIVMMSITESRYFGLNKTGKQIWTLLEQPKSFDEICNALSKEYNISLHQCINEVQPFFDELIGERIIV